MNIKKKIFAVFALLILGASLPQLATAHSLWINATSHSPVYNEKFGAQTKTYIGWGHLYPVADFLSADTLLEYSLIDPAGKKSDIKPAEAAGFLAAEVRMKSPGFYKISVVRKPGFYTMYEEKGAIHHRTGPKTGLSGIILSQYFEQYAKSLIVAGDAQGDAYKTPVGHKLEIVPLENPSKLKGNGGDLLPVQILFDGKPARYCQVLATYAGFTNADDFAFATVADGKGIAHIRLLHWGNWLVKANHRLPPPADMKDLCDTMNYTATLTLSIP